MKRWTVAVSFMWKNSDEGIDARLDNETEYLVPRRAHDRLHEWFVERDELDQNSTYASEEEAERDCEKLIEACDACRSKRDYSMFSEGMVEEMPDCTPEFIVPLCAEEVDV